LIALPIYYYTYKFMNKCQESKWKMTIYNHCY
jgi:hypothetical protein